MRRAPTTMRWSPVRLTLVGSLRGRRGDALIVADGRKAGAGGSTSSIPLDDRLGRPPRTSEIMLDDITRVAAPRRGPPGADGTFSFRSRFAERHLRDNERDRRGAR
jgi:hypothetical protein